MSILLVVDTVSLYLVIAVATVAVGVASAKDFVVALQLGLLLLKMLLIRCS